jgi:hypothetical protein
MTKPTVLWVGGKPFNVPPEFTEHFDIVKHIEQDEKRMSGRLPEVDFVIILTNWVSHNQQNHIKKYIRPGTPIVWVQKGWNAMKVELERRGILKSSKEEPVIDDADVDASSPIPADVQKLLRDYQDKRRLVDDLQKRKADLEAEAVNLTGQIAALKVQLEKAAPVIDSLQQFIKAAREAGTVL